jgi:hypothetical protein
MISPKEHHEDYQAALIWVTRQVEAAERQGLTLDCLGGWHRFTPDKKALEKAWRAQYSIPGFMTQLLTCPQEQWEQVVVRWLRHRDARG